MRLLNAVDQCLVQGLPRLMALMPTESDTVCETHHATHETTFTCDPGM